VHDSFRVQQVAGMFDVPLAAEQVEQFTAEAPGVDEPWEIGLVVGPSGSGKSTIARSLWPEAYTAAQNWPADRAVIEGFAAGSIREITAALTAVGFSSPPKWVKPYHVLSNGERFRCDLARAILEGGDLVVFDEFTSVVDRTVAKIASAAAAKAVRRMGRRFVAVSCHYDIAQWLEPDWVLDMQGPKLTRRRLRRPGIRLDIYRTDTAAWALFAKHHYLNAGLNRTAHCYVAMIAAEPAAFCAVLPVIGFAGRRRISRIVVRNDFQGVGIGRAMLNAVAGMYPRISITTGHPAMIAILKSDPHWKCTAVGKTGYARQRKAPQRKTFTGGPIGSSSTGRAVCSFSRVGPARTSESGAPAQWVGAGPP
jgi:energy-coupling factor transporter ATP-binding protein EcfA2